MSMSVPSTYPSSDTDHSIGLQVEWTKAQCRADRWEEEVILLDEEMRRVIEYCDWKAEWWMKRARDGRQVVSVVLADGLQAYAAQQARQELLMAVRFANMWVVARGHTRAIIHRVQGIVQTPFVLPDDAASDPIVIDIEVDQDDPDHEALYSDFEE